MQLERKEVKSDMGAVESRTTQREKKKMELELAVKPLHEWLCKYGDPYTTVTVMQDRATMSEEYMSVRMPVPD